MEDLANYLSNSENETDSSLCDNNCSGNGFCFKGECFCWPFYAKPSCEFQYKNIYPHWVQWMYLIQAIVLFTQSILFIHSGFLLFSRVKKKYFIIVNKKMTLARTFKRDIIIFILIGLVTASLIRIVHFAIDPHGYLTFMPYGVNLILFNIPILIWMDCVALLSFFWIDIQKRGFNTVMWLTKFQPIWISFICISAVVLLEPVIISIVLDDFLPILVSWVCWVAAIELFFTFLMSTNLYGGMKLLKELKKGKSQDPGDSKFLTKLTKLMIRLNVALSFALFMGFIWLVIYFLPNYQWSFLIVFTIEPLVEFIVVFSILWFLTVRKDYLLSRQNTLNSGSKGVSLPEYNPPETSFSKIPLKQKNLIDSNQSNDSTQPNDSTQQFDLTEQIDPKPIDLSDSTTQQDNGKEETLEPETQQESKD